MMTRTICLELAPYNITVNNITVNNIALEGVYIKEPMWFEYHEVEPVGPPHADSKENFI
jgi:NAD(P)-dependent dehydrogenase (short-subunit alcohol dehydrogenase family)